MVSFPKLSPVALLCAMMHLPAATLDRAGRTALGLSAPATRELAEILRSLPDAHLEWIMRSPLRRVVLDSIFWALPRYVDAERAAQVRAAVAISVTGRGDGGADEYQLEIVDGQARVRRGHGALASRITIAIDGAELLRLAVGRSDPMMAYSAGKLRIRGDLLSGIGLLPLLQIPRRRRRQVQRVAAEQARDRADPAGS